MSANHPLRLWRKTYGIPQKDLAKRAKMAQSYLCEIEAWEKEPSLELAARLSKITNIDIADFVMSDRHRAA